MNTKQKSLLVIVVFVVVLLLPVTYALIRGYFFADAKTNQPAVQQVK
jgi:hypothetical protein